MSETERSSNWMTDAYEKRLQKLIHRHMWRTGESVYKLSRDACGWQDGVKKFLEGGDIKLSSLKKIESHIRAREDRDAEIESEAAT